MQDDIAIKIENLSKQYRLGVVGTQTLRGDLQSWWHRLRGKEDPTVKIGDENKLEQAGGEYIWALRDINLEVKKGEVLGIIGKNGAGKSTLLKILSRVTGPTTGSVTAMGSISSLLEVGTGFHPELTGKENIYLNGAILGMTKAEIRKKIDEIVDFAGVAKYMDTPVKRYSSGMRVRLGFAVAAFLEPDILVVDEVLAVGDAEFQKKAIGKMQDVSKGEGRTVLFVSHNMASVENLCNKAIILENGHISYKGSVESSIKRYLTANNLTNKEITSNYVTFVKIVNSENQISNQIFMGKGFKVQIGTKNLNTLPDIHIGIFIKDHFGKKITAFSTAMNPPKQKRSFTSSELVTFVFDKAYFVEGKYMIDISVSYKNSGRVEFIENATTFNVQATDVYNNGTLLNSHFGNIYIDGSTYIEKI